MYVLDSFHLSMVATIVCPSVHEETGTLPQVEQALEMASAQAIFQPPPDAVYLSNPGLQTLPPSRCRCGAVPGYARCVVPVIRSLLTKGWMELLSFSDLQSWHAGHGLSGAV